MATLLGLVGLTFMAVAIIGWLWITVTAFSEGDVLWGVGCLIISPLSVVYGIMNWYELKLPVIMVAVGFFGRVFATILAAGLS